MFLGSHTLLKSQDLSQRYKTSSHSILFFNYKANVATKSYPKGYTKFAHLFFGFSFLDKK